MLSKQQKGAFNMKIKVLAVECYKEPRVIEIENELKPLQEYVCGNIEVVNISPTACIICNEEGKFIPVRPNRKLGNDMIFGDFLVAGLGCDGFCNLSDEDIEKFKVFLENPKRSIWMPERKIWNIFL